MSNLTAAAFAVAFALGWGGDAAAEAALTCDGRSVCVDPRSGLAARVLTRPAARLLNEANAAGEVVRGALPAFRPWFVFEERDIAVSASGEAQGWYKVGQSPEAPTGWLSAADALPWRSALVVTYAYPGVDPETRRSPVLMFDSLASLQNLVAADDPGAYVAELRAAVEAGDVTRFRGQGLVSIEPRRFVDFRRGFYILPVLDFARLPLFDSEARMLKLAAAVPQSKRDLGRGATRLDDPTYRKNVVTGPTTEGTGARELVVEMKFVIDMTASMQPQIDAVARAIKQLASLLGHERRNARFRYGLVGYTDVEEQCDGCPFVMTRDFFPEGGVGADQLLSVLRASPQARAGGGGDWAEAALEGVAAAISGPWRENSLRFVILIGDASANPFGGDKNKSVSVESVRTLADAADVRIVALHAEQRPGAPKEAPQEGPPAAKAASEDARPPWHDAPIARGQFAALALNPGQRSPSYLNVEIDPDDPTLVRQRYYDTVYALAERLAGDLDALRAGELETSVVARAQPEGEDLTARVGDLAGEAFDAALISYLGEPAQRPRDLTFWSLDVDPRDFVTPSLEVRVLLEKRELENLIRTLETLLEAFLRSKSMDSRAFFERLQASSAAAALDGDLSARAAQSVSETGLLPRWLAALPYRSQVMRLTSERFAAMSADERDRLEQSIQRKLFAYRDLYASDEWIALWPGADEFDKVYPLLLSDMP